MKNVQEKIIHFELNNKQGITITHGYNISNAFPVHFHSTYNFGIIELGERIYLSWYKNHFKTKRYFYYSAF